MQGGLANRSSTTNSTLGLVSTVTGNYHHHYANYPYKKKTPHILRESSSSFTSDSYDLDTSVDDLEGLEEALDRASASMDKEGM